MTLTSKELHSVVKNVAQSQGCRSKGATVWHDAPGLRGMVWVQRSQWGDQTLYVNIQFAKTPANLSQAPRLVRGILLSVRAEAVPGSPAELIRGMFHTTGAACATPAQVETVLQWCCMWMKHMAANPRELAELVADQSSWWQGAAGSSYEQRDWAHDVLAASTPMR